MSTAKMKEKNSPIDYIEAKESRWEHDAAAKKNMSKSNIIGVFSALQNKHVRVTCFNIGS